MALQSEVSPPLVGDPNKDTKIDGDTKSEEENDSSQSTDEDVDLEEGEILDSGEEEEEEKKDFTNSSLKEALDKNFLKSIEQLVSQAKTEASPPNPVPKNMSPHNSPLKMKKRPSKYMDHDRFDSTSDPEDGWYTPSKKLKSKFDAKPIDYRMELEAYRGTPPSSPDRKHKDDKKKKRSSRKSKKSSKKSIKRKDAKGLRIQYRKESMRKKMCKFFKEGKCAKGSDCPYSHASPQSFKKKELCKFYLSGHCNKGSDCIYMHNEFPCKFYHTGSECYAKDDCRFSHAPLTEEMERVLADYLKIPHGDDDYDRKRRSSPSPEPKAPPAKRTCLLGSPPRHIREAEETKRWQEEMLKQQQNHPGFKIHISPSRDGSPPPPAIPKPNFYQETLPSTPSPKKHRKNLGAASVPVSTSFPPPPSSTASGFPLPNANDSFPQESPERYIYDDDYQEMGEMSIKQEPPDFSWTNIRGIDHNLPPLKNEMEPFVEPAQQDLDFTNDVKFDETTQFSEMESLTDGNETSPPNSVSQTATNKESEEESSNQGNIKTEDKAADDSSSNQEPPSPIIIPSHLPKKQQELFKRIQQHQRKNAVTAVASDVSNSPKAFDTSEPQVKEEPEEVKEKPETEKADSLWYSSEDDDDDDTVEPLTNVLKKLQKEPPVVNPPVKMEPRPAADIMAMLNKIQQNTLEKKKAASESKPETFLKNLLLGNIPAPAESKQPPLLNVATSETKRRTLLPDPQPISVPAIIKKEPIIAPKDPRLRNRDPRTVASTISNSVSLPKTNIEQNVSKIISSVTTQEHITSTFSTTITTAVTESAKDNKPYKLHGIYTKPPNYTPYINASQSNPSLLKDPRLRKHLNLNQKKENGSENCKDADSIKVIPAKNAPPIPKLLLKFDKSDSLSINIFESSSTTPKPVIENIQDSKITRPKLTDPRMRKRESQTNLGSNTPPHLTVESAPVKLKTEPLEDEIKPYEKKWSPPVLEKSWTPPVVDQKWTIKQEIKQEVDSDTEDPLRLQIDEGPQDPSIDANVNDNNSTTVTKKVKPTPASHLPRAIADPRMAKLHSPLDSRRPRITVPESSNKNTAELKKLNHNVSSLSDNSSDASLTFSSDTAVVESESLKTVKNIPKKHSSEKNEEKKKTVHRNRKSSMDYASPLNSCDDSNKNLTYNSYNQRPPRTGVSKSVSDSPVSNTASNLTISDLTPDFLSDNSLECDNNIDVNLKDRFKTIDPTASPFC